MEYKPSNSNDHMPNTWTYISNLGIKGKNSSLNQRSIVFCNQLNLVMLISLFLLMITTIITMVLTGDSLSYGTLRIGILLVVSFLNLLLSRFGFTGASRLSLIFLPPVVFLLGPTLIGYVEEESYTYYPYVVISASIIPQLILLPQKEKFLYWFSLGYYFVLVLCIDKLMVHFGGSFPIVDRINTFYPFYKISQIGLFLFISSCIYYLRVLNFRFEDELKNKNDELDLQNKKLKAQKEEIEKHKDELISKEINTWQNLVGIISHEIINSAIPITNLAGMTGQMLEDENGDVLKSEMIGDETTGDIHRSLQIIESRTQALINFVNATKSITHIPNPSIRKIYLNELVDRIATLFKKKFTDEGIVFEKQIIPESLSAEIDLELIEQVMINLIQNAMEAMKERTNPVITITALINESNQVQIAVSDNGIGIEEEARERIFLPFYSTKATNSGIGLSLSQQIMVLHNARIEVTSVVDQGTTFTLTF